MKAFISLNIRLLVFLVSSMLFCQNLPPLEPNQTIGDLREGQWTFWYDEDVDVIESEEDAFFYAFINFKAGDPDGNFNLYGSDGEQIMSGTFKAKNPEGNWDINQFQQYPRLVSPENVFAKIYEGIGEEDAALFYYLKALDLIDENDPGFARVQTNLAYLYHSMRDTVNSLAYFQLALESAEKTLGTENETYWEYSDNLAGIYFNAKDFEEALPMYLSSLEFIGNTKGKNHREYIDRLYDLGAYYRIAGDLPKALEFNTEALERAEETLGKEHSFYGDLLSAQGSLFSAMGDYRTALTFQLEALENAEKTLGKTHLEYSFKLNSIALVYYMLGDYDRSMNNMTQALGITENILGRDHVEFAKQLTNMGAIYRMMGEYDKALPLFLEGLDITERTQGKDTPEYGIRQNQLIALYINMGDYSKALPLLLNSLEKTEQSLGKNHFEYARQLNLLGALYYYMGNYEKALPAYHEALEVAEATIGKEHSEYGSYLNNLGSVYKEIKDYSKALFYYLEALENTEKALGKDNPAYGQCLYNLALLYHAMENYSKALPYYRGALDNAEKALGKNHPEYGNKLTGLASFYRDTDEYSKAIPLFFESFENQKYQINRVFSFLPESGKEKFMRRENKKVDSFQSFVLDFSEENPEVYSTSYDMELLTKGLILNSGIDLQRRISESGDAELNEKYLELKSYKNLLAREYSKPISARSPNLKDMEETVEKLEGEISRKTNAITDMQQLGKISWSDIQNRLKADEVAIEFSSFRYLDGNHYTETVEYMALVLRKDYEAPIRVKLFTQEELDEALLATGTEDRKINQIYRGGLAQSELYELVWEPLLPYVNEGETVYYSPSGTLHQISLSIINTPQREYLLDKYNFVRLSSTSKLIDKDTVPQLNNLVLFGDIDYNLNETLLARQETFSDGNSFVSRALPDDLQRDRSLSFSLLPGTAEEVINIESYASQNRVRVKSYVKDNALEGSFKSLSGADSPDVLHIATHGFFFPDPENLEEEVNDNVFRLSDNPLNRSGLLFSGANHTWMGETGARDAEDGILTAYEISQMYLPNTELVVLSACETGLGEIKGSEGVFGLQRAFKAAGVNYLMMSLWKVPDDETAEFMKKFYEELFKSKNIENSFRETQKYMMSKYPEEPYKWAAFVLLR